MGRSIIYVGLDVHKDTIAVALAEAGLRGEVREHGKIPNTPAALKALTVKLARETKALRFCYEAGPCGYGIQRQLSAIGHDRAVVAPSLIPRKPGARSRPGEPSRVLSAGFYPTLDTRPRKLRDALQVRR
jgi:transposase